MKKVAEISTLVADRTIKAMHERLSLQDQYQTAINEQASLERKIADNVYSSAVKQAEREADKLALLDKQAEVKALGAKVDEENYKKIDARLESEKKLAESIAKIKKDDADAEAKRLKEIGEENLAYYKEGLRLDKQLHDQKLAGLTTEQRIATLNKEIASLKKEQKGYDKDSNEYKALQAKIGEKSVEVQGELATLTERTAKAEQDVADAAAAAEKKKAAEAKAYQQTTLESTGRGNEQLSDREIQRKIDAIKKDILARQVAAGYAPTTVGLGSGGYDPFLEAQKSNLFNAQNQLNLRRDVRQTAATQGESAAFARFGNLSEAQFREIIQGNNTTGLLTEIRDLFKNGQARVINAPIVPPGG